jgi:hypothetical protein
MRELILAVNQMASKALKFLLLLGMLAVIAEGRGKKKKKGGSVGPP